jgi:hypothetical protein
MVVNMPTKVSMMGTAAVAVALSAGCADDPTMATASAEPSYPGGPGTYSVVIPNPEFTGGAEILRATLPEQWSVIEDSDAPATRGLIGYAAGGNLDIPLRFDVAFEGTIEDLQPPAETACYHHGEPPHPAASVEDITAQTGDGTPYRKMGDRTADYRVWRANCPDEFTTTQIHQAWLLPDSDIAIYEQRPTEFNNTVVESMQLLR